MDLMTILLAAGGGANAGGGMGSTLIMFALIFGIMYFLMIRPQQKKAKDMQKFREELGKGMKIVTIGGIHGRILEVREKTFVVEVGNGLKLEIEKSAISMENTKAVQTGAPAPAPASTEIK